jgi:hypothetical protein
MVVATAGKRVECQTIGLKTADVICRCKEVNQIGEESLEMTAMSVRCATHREVGSWFGTGGIPLLAHLAASFQENALGMVNVLPVILTKDGDILDRSV